MRLAWPLTLLLCASALAQQPDYFPLHVGNQWVYRVSGTRESEPLALSITRGSSFNGVPYVLLEGWGQGNFWLRQDANGNLYSYSPEAQAERLWYSFFAEPGQAYRNELPWCCGTGRVVSRNARYQGPVGNFQTALEIGDPTVFQLGLVRELFLPYIGMVHRTLNTGGPSVMVLDLIYARVGGVTVVEEQSISFRMSVDRTLYFSDQMPPATPERAVPQLTARLTLRNTQDRPLMLNFPTSQNFDLIIRNDKGEKALQWSDGRVFPQVLQPMQVGPGERNFVIVLRLGVQNRPLPPGRYTAEAWLTTEGRPAFWAQTAFELQHVF
jgi:hypothetical protein